MSRFTWIFAVLGLLAFAVVPTVTMAEGHEQAEADVAAPADEAEEAEAAPAEGEAEEAEVEESESEGGTPE